MEDEVQSWGVKVLTGYNKMVEVVYFCGGLDLHGVGFGNNGQGSVLDWGFIKIWIFGSGNIKVSVWFV